MEGTILVILAISFIRIFAGAFRSHAPKAYFIPSLSWYKAKLKINRREDYRPNSIYMIRRYRK